MIFMSREVPDHPKALWRRAAVRAFLGQLDGAAEDYRSVVTFRVFIFSQWRSWDAALLHAPRPQYRQFLMDTAHAAPLPRMLLDPCRYAAAISGSWCGNSVSNSTAAVLGSQAWFYCLQACCGGGPLAGRRCRQGAGAHAAEGRGGGAAAEEAVEGRIQSIDSSDH